MNCARTEKTVGLEIQVLTQSRVCRSCSQSAHIYWWLTPFQARCHVDTASALFMADTLIMIIIWVRRCLGMSPTFSSSNANSPHPRWHTSQESHALSKDPQGHGMCRLCHLWPIPAHSSLEIQSLLKQCETTGKRSQVSMTNENFLIVLHWKTISFIKYQERRALWKGGYVRKTSSRG